MAHYYYQTEARTTSCEVCGYLTLCDVLAADYCESETGYLDELVLSPSAGGTGGPMRIHFKSRTGYEPRADIEEVTMLGRLDGLVVTSVPGAHCNECLLTPEEAERVIEELNWEE